MTKIQISTLFSMFIKLRLNIKLLEKTHFAIKYCTKLAIIFLTTRVSQKYCNILLVCGLIYHMTKTVQAMKRYPLWLVVS